MVSSDGGENPVWQHDGRRLIYQGTNQVLMQVDVNTESAFSTSTPSNLFPVNLKATDGNRYLITADGKRILANELAPTDLNKAGAMIIQNWTVALNR